MPKPNQQEKNVHDNLEFDFIYDLYRLLNPLKELTVYLSASKYVTTSFLHPSIYKLVTFIYPEMKFSDPSIEKLKIDLIQNLKRRFIYVLNPNMNDFFIMAPYLDFKYRKFSYLNDDSKSTKMAKRAQNIVIKYYKLYLEHKNAEISQVETNA
ncbi:zinc finger BED domain-containing 4-like [Brachionus plicatilis]|uniref:Zinc finger BED domain-containing 4-like n=1 Tax=Brachionus plicatilis TaxID=10195 RepID=A0A3M7R6Z7_BRAPC|nr:zinc finger BED domain-containing 4-like [Brachionus plicatilis]